MPTAKYDRLQYATDFKARHGAYERRAYKVFKSALDAQVQPVIDYINHFGAVNDSLIDLLVTKSPMETAYKEVYTTIGVRHARWTRKWINSIGKQQKDFFSEQWQELMELFFLNESGTRITEVTDTTREMVRRLLAEATEQRLTISQTATYMLDNLSSRDFNRNRALVIARTESTTAANKGAMLGNADADYETVKEWIGISDARQRHTHREANGQTVEPNEDFIVGGELAAYPGDLRLSAAEVIQCRCTVAFVPKTDEMGLPILK